MDLASLSTGLSSGSVSSGAAAGSTATVKPVTARPTSIVAGADDLPARSRAANPADPGYITVEPDGRDDITFRDRLRQAIEGFFKSFDENAEARTDRALAAIEESLAAAESGGESVFVQLRVVAIDITVADPGDDASGYASVRQLGLEIGVARDGAVRAEDTAVLGLDGRSAGLTQTQVAAGLSSGRFERRETGDGQRSAAASERLAAIQAGLDRIRATQEALKAFRAGDLEPIRRVLDGGDDRAASAVLGAVFPGIGAVSLDR